MSTHGSTDAVCIGRQNLTPCLQEVCVCMYVAGGGEEDGDLTNYLHGSKDRCVIKILKQR